MAEATPMAIVTDGDFVPSPIPNTTMREKLRNGVLYAYALKAVDGYILHDNRGCWTRRDDITGEEILMHAFYRGTCTCAASYDFEANPYDFYAAPKDLAGESIKEVTV